GAGPQDGAAVRRGERRHQPRACRGRLAGRPPARALRPAVGRRRELHGGGGRRPGHADRADRGLGAAAGGLAGLRYDRSMTEARPPAERAPEEEYVDELPEDLDLTGFVGPHTFPNNDRRRIPAALYAMFGIACIVLWATRGDESPLVNAGILWAGIGLVAFAAYGLVTGRTLRVDESDALVTASAQVGFPVGHARSEEHT